MMREILSKNLQSKIKNYHFDTSNVTCNSLLTLSQHKMGKEMSARHWAALGGQKGALLEAPKTLI
jgi:hypothetical protein